MSLLLEEPRLHFSFGRGIEGESLGRLARDVPLVLARSQLSRPFIFALEGNLGTTIASWQRYTWHWQDILIIRSVCTHTPLAYITLQTAWWFLLEQIMRNNPLIAISKCKYFCTIDKKHAPIENMLVYKLSAIGGLKYCLHLVQMLVQPVQPRLQCLGVVLAVETPVVHNTEVLLKVKEEVVRCHCAPRKEIPGHPLSVWALLHVELVGKLSVT